MPANVNPEFLPEGLWALRDISFDPHNSWAIRIRFSQKATNLHKKHLLDAIHSWMTAQKMLADHGGKITPEQAVALMQAPAPTEEPDAISKE